MSLTLLLILFLLHIFGFMRGRSSQQQLLVMLNEIFSNKNCKTCSDIVYLDISKAFDSVSRDILLLKLQLMGISGTILNWFKAYLDNRRQLVSVNGSFSGFLPVTVVVSCSLLTTIFLLHCILSIIS